MISILMPIYNGIEFIDESVSSILRQTYEQWELIIAINGHPCGSEVYKTAKKYEKSNNKIRVFDFYDTIGKANTLNKMIPLCKYEHIALLDVDDIWMNDKLMIQTQHDIFNNFDVIGSKCVYFGDMSGIIPDIPTGDISEFDFKRVNPMINSSSIIRKELCFWNENGIEDYDLWLRLRKDGRKFYNFKEILVKHRIHNDSAFNAKGNHLKVHNLLQNF
jgi:glycosyltransferase involved in cell wall biosynthesis